MITWPAAIGGGAHHGRGSEAHKAPCRRVQCGARRGRHIAMRIHGHAARVIPGRAARGARCDQRFGQRQILGVQRLRLPLRRLALPPHSHASATRPVVGRGGCGASYNLTGFGAWARVGPTRRHPFFPVTGALSARHIWNVALAVGGGGVRGTAILTQRGEEAMLALFARIWRGTGQQRAARGTGDGETRIGGLCTLTWAPLARLEARAEGGQLVAVQVAVCHGAIGWALTAALLSVRTKKIGQIRGPSAPTRGVASAMSHQLPAMSRRSTPATFHPSLSRTRECETERGLTVPPVSNACPLAGRRARPATASTTRHRPPVQ